jgi:hypothetical protein
LKIAYAQLSTSRLPTSTKQVFFYCYNSQRKHLRTTFNQPSTLGRFFFSHLWGLRKLLPFQDMMKFSASELRKFFNLALQKFSTLQLLLKTSLSSKKINFEAILET